MRGEGQRRDEGTGVSLAKVYSRDITSTECLSSMVITHEDLSWLNS